MRPERIPVNTLWTAANNAERPEAAYSATTLANHALNLGGYQLAQGLDPTSSDAQPGRTRSLSPS